jgi:hypothetical protein
MAVGKGGVYVHAFGVLLSLLPVCCRTAAQLLLLLLRKLMLVN